MSEGSGTENAGRRVIPPPTQGISLIPSSKGRFRDVSISDILDERSYAVEGNVLRIYLKLAGPPPVGWAFMFNTVWESVS